MTAADLDREKLRVLLGGATHMTTACGTISLSVDQTGWAVQAARRRSRLPELAHLTDLDVAWLLTRGWTP